MRRSKAASNGIIKFKWKFVTQIDNDKASIFFVNRNRIIQSIFPGPWQWQCGLNASHGFPPSRCLFNANRRFITKSRTEMCCHEPLKFMHYELRLLYAFSAVRVQCIKIKFKCLWSDQLTRGAAAVHVNKSSHTHCYFTANALNFNFKNLLTPQ